MNMVVAINVMCLYWALRQMSKKVYNQLTRLGKNHIPELKNRLHTERAINLLYDYESTGLTPLQIQELQETVYNLRQRLKKLEDWQ